MLDLSMSRAFREAAACLPKDAKAKLFKIFLLLGENPRHPSLQLKKIQGSRRADIYECRVDRSLRMVVRLAGESGIELVYVGAHDEAIRHGSRVAEEAGAYGGAPAGHVAASLEGDDEWTACTPVSMKDLSDLLDIADDG